MAFWVPAGRSYTNVQKFWVGTIFSGSVRQCLFELKMYCWFGGQKTFFFFFILTDSKLLDRSIDDWQVREVAGLWVWVRIYSHFHFGMGWGSFLPFLHHPAVCPVGCSSLPCCWGSSEAKETFDKNSSGWDVKTGKKKNRETQSKKILIYLWQPIHVTRAWNKINTVYINIIKYLLLILLNTKHLLRFLKKDIICNSAVLKLT